jgi:hypothetical protein
MSPTEGFPNGLLRHGVQKCPAAEPPIADFDRFQEQIGH